ELEARAEAFHNEVSGAERSVAEARGCMVGLEDAVVLLNEAIGREEREAITRELTASGLTQEIERADRHLRVVADDAARLEEERNTLSEKRLKTLADAAAAEDARLAATEAVNSASAMLADARRSAEQQNAGLGTQRAAAAAAGERRRATTTELRRLENEATEVNARIERHSFELVEMTNRLDELSRSIEEIDDRVAASGEE